MLPWAFVLVQRSRRCTRGSCCVRRNPGKLGLLRGGRSSVWAETRLRTSPQAFPPGMQASAGSPGRGSVVVLVRQPKLMAPSDLAESLPRPCHEGEVPTSTPRMSRGGRRECWAFGATPEGEVRESLRSTSNPSSAPSSVPTRVMLHTAHRSAGAWPPKWPDPSRTDELRFQGQPPVDPLQRTGRDGLWRGCLAACWSGVLRCACLAARTSWLAGPSPSRGLAARRRGRGVSSVGPRGVVPSRRTSRRR